MNQATRNRSEELHCSYSINLEDAAPRALEEANQKEHLKPGFHIVVSVVSVVRKKFIGQI